MMRQLMSNEQNKEEISKLIRLAGWHTKNKKTRKNKHLFKQSQSNCRKRRKESTI